MGVFKKVLWELALILASVLIFRSAWTIIDRVNPMNSELGLWGSFILGVVVAAISLFVLNAEVMGKRLRE
jgi:hypothetical protein